jgi:hypothetical protein
MRTNNEATPSQSKYNPNKDFSKGFNHEPQCKFSEITEEQREKALVRLENLIQNTWSKLTE